MEKKSQIRRNAMYPARMQMSARTSRGTSSVDEYRAAASRTAPAAVTHDRSGVGERKNASAGNEVWLSSTSVNHVSHRDHISSLRLSRRPSTVNRISMVEPDGGFPARTSSDVTNPSRREKA